MITSSWTGGRAGGAGGSGRQPLSSQRRILLSGKPRPQHIETFCLVKRASQVFFHVKILFSFKFLHSMVYDFMVFSIGKSKVLARFFKTVRIMANNNKNFFKYIPQMENFQWEVFLTNLPVCL